MDPNKDLPIMYDINKQTSTYVHGIKCVSTNQVYMVHISLHIESFPASCSVERRKQMGIIHQSPWKSCQDRNGAPEVQKPRDTCVYA